MKYLIYCLIGLFSIGIASAQSDSVQHIPRLEIKKKKNYIINKGDSSITVIIDTLIMHDRARLEFFGKTDVRLEVRHAVISKDAYIAATDGKNNASNIDITMKFEKLGGLYVLAGGRDAQNGSRTFPNGNGGNVVFNYVAGGIVPQTDDRKADHYLRIDTRAGGYAVNARSDLYNIYSRIGGGMRPLGQLPQGQVYSGSPGRDGKSEIKEVSGF